MEFGSSHDEMVFDDFDHLEKTIDHMHQIVEKRQMMTGSEKQKLHSLKEKIRLYADIEKKRQERAKGKIEHLLKTYYSYYNG